MELLFNKDTVELFSRLIQYNVSTYIDLYHLFIQDSQPAILSYFKESDVEPDAQSFDFLEKMLVESTKIDNLVKIHRNAFSSIDQWELLYFLEEIRTKLETIQNTSKWIGSSKTKNSWRSTSIQVDHTLNQNQTLENISAEVYGENGSQDDWARIALENDLLENDYSVEGGNNIQVTKKVASTPNFYLRSVVDTLVKDTLYGLDIDRKITFENDDLKVLSYSDTAKQSIEILIMLKKGDVPEFPGFGVDANTGVGGNLGSFYFTSIARQLSKVFSSDDTLRNFNVVNVEYQNGDIVLHYSVDTMYNLTFNSNTKIKQA